MIDLRTRTKKRILGNVFSSFCWRECLFSFFTYIRHSRQFSIAKLYNYSAIWNTFLWFNFIFCWLFQLLIIELWFLKCLIHFIIHGIPLYGVGKQSAVLYISVNVLLFRLNVHTWCRSLCFPPLLHLCYLLLCWLSHRFVIHFAACSRQILNDKTCAFLSFLNITPWHKFKL